METNPFSIINERFNQMEALIKQLIDSSAGSTSEPAVKSDENSDKLLTAAEIASIINVSIPTVLRHARNGVYPFYKPGKNYMFKKTEVESAISSQTPLKRNKKGGPKS